MAKAPADEPPQDTLQIILDKVLDLSRLVAKLEAEVQDLGSRAGKLEAAAIEIDESALLPREIREGVTPGDIYTAAVSAFIIGIIGSNPSLLIKHGPGESKTGLLTIDRAIEFGDLAAKAFEVRFGKPRTTEKAKSA